jgi:ketosteroid isomerase-like protein
MKHFLCAFITAFVLLSSSFATEPRAPAKTPTASEKQLLALTQDWADAEVKRDEPTLRRVLDDDFIATFGAGKPINKVDYIKAIVDEPDTILSQTLTDETIRVAGDAAVLVGTVDILSTAQGRKTTTRYRYTATYIKRSGNWAALSLHMVKAPPVK